VLEIEKDWNEEMRTCLERRGEDYDDRAIIVELRWSAVVASFFLQTFVCVLASVLNFRFTLPYLTRTSILCTLLHVLAVDSSIVTHVIAPC
jgi:hypothetical protein